MAFGGATTSHFPWSVKEHLLADYAHTEIPSRFWSLTIDSFKAETRDQQEMQEATADWIENLKEHREAGRGLCYLGDPGLGKTMLACIAGVAACDKGMSVFYTTLTGYLRRGLREMALRDAWKQADDGHLYAEWKQIDARLIELRNRVEILILDDVGKEHATNTRWAEDEFDFLVRHRFDLGLPTIMTSNTELKHWAVHYSDAMHSFIQEACVVVEARGRDARIARSRKAGVVRRPGTLGGDG